MTINIFTKNEIISLIKACDSIGTLFANSAALKRTGGGRAEKMRQTMLSYKNIFVHFYGRRGKCPWIAPMQPNQIF